MKLEYQKPARMLNPLPILESKWENMAMHFIVGLLVTFNKYDSIWIIVDKLTKTIHLFPIRTIYSMDKLA